MGSLSENSDGKSLGLNFHPKFRHCLGQTESGSTSHVPANLKIIPGSLEPLACCSRELPPHAVLPPWAAEPRPPSPYTLFSCVHSCCHSFPHPTSPPPPPPAAPSSQQLRSSRSLWRVSTSVLPSYLTVSLGCPTLTCLTLDPVKRDLISLT